jgi:hypothetical protein
LLRGFDTRTLTVDVRLPSGEVAGEMIRLLSVTALLRGIGL